MRARTDCERGRRRFDAGGIAFGGDRINYDNLKMGYDNIADHNRVIPRNPWTGNTDDIPGQESIVSLAAAIANKLPPPSVNSVSTDPQDQRGANGTPP